jgi:ABC-type antimicrobial peptide transport system permease subunit
MFDERIPDALKASMGDEYERLLNRRYAPLTAETIAALTALPYVNRTSTRYMTAGISEDGFLRADSNTQHYNYTHRLIVEGTISGIWQGWNSSGPGGAQVFSLHMTDLTVLAGHPEIWANVGGDFPFILQVVAFPTAALQNPNGLVYRNTNRYFTWESLSASAILPELGLTDIAALEWGGRYIFTACFNAQIGWVMSPVFTGDRAMQTQWQTLYSITGQSENYLEKDEFADLRDLIALIEDDRRTFDMVYTDDMRAIPRFRENTMRITEGRMLTPRDIETNALVCVVSKQFADSNNLSTGDTITMRLGDALHSQNAQLGAMSVIKERRPNAETITELEIVGVYDDFDTQRLQTENPFWNYSKDTIFVPLSLLAETADIANQAIYPGEFSLIVNARDISAFKRESTKAIEEMGLTLFFADDGWAAVESRFAVMLRLSVVAVAGIFAAALFTFALTVNLFIGRKKKDYAIMRALGTSRKRANRRLFVPLFLIAFFAVICGGISGIIYADSIIESSLEALAESGFSVDTSIPPAAFIICIIAEIALLCGFTLFGLWRLSLKSPLALLQNSAENTKKRKEKEAQKAPEALETDAQRFTLPALSNLPRDRGRLRFIARHIKLRSRRALFKTLLPLLLAAVFIGAIGQFAAMKFSYEDLFESMEITATFTRGLFVNRTNEPELSDFVKSRYYEFTLRGTEMDGKPITIYMSGDLERFIGSTQTHVEYAPGYDEELLLGNEFLCIMSADLMDALGLEFGNEASICRIGFRENLAINQNMTEEEKVEFLRSVSLHFTVAGRFETDNESFKNSVFLPLGVDLKPIFRWVEYTPIYSFAQYVLADNSRANEFREYAAWMLGKLFEDESFVMDTSELDAAAANMRLWSALFPVVAAALIITGGLLPGLIIMQSSKDAAIFRILGTTKRRTRFILTLQQLLFCLPGIILGIAAVRLYNGSELFSKIAPTALLCAALYLAACVLAITFSAVSVTKQKVLDLLQTKE